MYPHIFSFLPPMITIDNFLLTSEGLMELRHGYFILSMTLHLTPIEKGRDAFTTAENEHVKVGG